MIEAVSAITLAFAMIDDFFLLSMRQVLDHINRFSHFFIHYKNHGKASKQADWFTASKLIGLN